MKMNPQITQISQPYLSPDRATNSDGRLRVFSCVFVDRPARHHKNPIHEMTRKVTNCFCGIYVICGFLNLVN